MHINVAIYQIAAIIAHIRLRENAKWLCEKTSERKHVAVIRGRGLKRTQMHLPR